MSWGLEVAGRTLCQEVRGEPIEGQEAVAHVIKNRLADGRWGKSLASVCLWRAQFSGWYMPHDPNFAYACSLPDDDKTLSHMCSVMQAALDSDIDPTNGSMWYYAPKVISAPQWTVGAIFCGKFGSQLFYKGVK